MAGDGSVKIYIYEHARIHYAAAEAIVALLPPSSGRQRRHVDMLVKAVKTVLLNVPPEENLERLAGARVQSEPALRSRTGFAQRGSCRPPALNRVAHHLGDR